MNQLRKPSLQSIATRPTILAFKTPLFWLLLTSIVCLYFKWRWSNVQVLTNETLKIEANGCDFDELFNRSFSEIIAKKSELEPGIRHHNRLRWAFFNYISLCKIVSNSALCQPFFACLQMNLGNETAVVESKYWKILLLITDCKRKSLVPTLIVGSGISTRWCVQSRELVVLLLANLVASRLLFFGGVVVIG